MGDNDLRRRRHAGPQEQFGIVRRENGLIGDNALDDFGAVTQLPNLGGEGFIGMGIDREARLLPFTHAADVGLIYVDLNLHLRKILGDGEQHGGLKRRGHRLARLDDAA